jgi:hypothetical protein
MITIDLTSTHVTMTPVFTLQKKKKILLACAGNGWKRSRTPNMLRLLFSTTYVLPQRQNRQTNNENRSPLRLQHPITPGHNGPQMITTSQQRATTATHIVENKGLNFSLQKHKKTIDMNQNLS